MDRYQQLDVIINDIKPAVIAEIGTWTGGRAVAMLGAALKHRDEVTYRGYDLFEDMTDELDVRELNVKRHVTLEEVTTFLQQWANELPSPKKVQFELHKIDTREIKEKIQADFVFIDGGHSVETMAHDVDITSECRVAIIDDFYTSDEQGGCPDLTKYGFNAVRDALPDKDQWKTLGQKDSVRGGGYVQMCIRGWNPRVNLQVKTKNCVPNEDIIRNMHYVLGLNLQTIVECAPHRLRALFISAGPSYKKYLSEIRDLSVDPNTRLICVKHSHDYLIERDIIPWACVLLDPRDHVQNFIGKPHPKVIYLVASMVHKTTIDQLTKNSANIWTYHPLVGAGEDKVVPKGQFLVPGGSTAATRGLVVLHTLGFRHFVCYGYDSCYTEQPDMKAKSENGQPKYFHVNVSGRYFWSDGELIAQAQDFERLMREWVTADVEVRGDGMVGHVYRNMRGVKPRFEDMFNS